MSEHDVGWGKWKLGFTTYFGACDPEEEYIVCLVLRAARFD
jgi:hypothetical protein